MLCLRITSLALILAVVRPRPWLVHLLRANSLVGFVYMIVEWRALRDVGTCLPFGLGALRSNVPTNVAINVLTHVALPALVMPRAEPSSIAPLVGLGVLYLATAKLHGVYPTSVLPLEVYIATHLTTLLGSWYWENKTHG